MFCECQALIKSIDAYIKKEDDTLADSLKKRVLHYPKNREEHRGTGRKSSLRYFRSSLLTLKNC